MRRFITLAVAAVFLLSTAGPTMAVEKKDKKTKQTAKVVKKTVPKKTAVKSTTPPKALQPKLRPTVKKFDNFIDKNKNGIDDRCEKLMKKAPKKQTAKKEAKKPKKK